MIKINIDKAKIIAHDKRRHDRDEKMKPLDIEATIPAMAEEAEAKRQVIRDKNAEVQVKIDKATKVSVLKDIIDKL